MAAGASVGSHLFPRGAGPKAKGVAPSGGGGSGDGGGPKAGKKAGKATKKDAKRAQELADARARLEAKRQAELDAMGEAHERDFETRAVSTLVDTIRAALRPNEAISPDKWADKFRLLPSESSAEPGRWRTSRTPYLREILQELDPANPRQEIAVCKGAQVGFSECGLGWLLFLIDVAPGPMLGVQPTIELAQRFSKQRVAPSLDKCPRLKGKIADRRSRDSSNSLLQKDFTGGTLILGGANSAVGLRSIPVRYLFLDEVDGYPDDCDGEGDPVTLAVRRTATFRRRKILYGSTPKYTATSRIWPLYEDSDKREYHVPCPHCGERQPITWEALAWEPGKPETAHMVCRECGCVVEESAKPDMLGRGAWVPQNPGHKRAGFFLSSLYSPLGWYSWAEAARDYEAALTDPTKMQTFRNTVLGLPWEEDGEGADMGELERRAEDYGAADAPAGALVLTASVDVQAKRLEVEVVGWGVGKESYPVEYRTLYGDPAVLVSDDPARPSVWQELDKLLSRTWTTADGRRMVLSCTCVDSGYLTSTVFAYCKAREARRIFAIKGVGGPGKPLIGKPSRANRYRAAVFPLGVDAGKELVYARLKLPEPGPGYCHFPQGRGYDGAYFTGLTSEKHIVRMVQGRPRLYWVKVKSNSRNEPLDLRVYATAALELLRVDLDRMAAQLALARAAAQAQAGQTAWPGQGAPANDNRTAGQGRQVRRGTLSAGVKL